MRHPIYIVFAGVNGAGKSTLYRSNLWAIENLPLHTPRINPDEILKENGGDWKKTVDQITAGKIALSRIEAYLQSRKSFNQETTLTGRKSVQTIRTAHEKGYRIFVFYVGVASPEIALERIEHRVSLGGHNIDSFTVQRRFYSSIENLSNIIDYCEQVHIFDNTVNFRRIGIWEHGVLRWWGASQAIGAWLPEAIQDESRWRTLPNK